MKWVLSPAVLAEDGTVIKAEAAIQYGSFIQNIVNFLIIAFSIFFAIRMVSKAAERFKKKEEPKPAAPKAPTEAELLTEIRDFAQSRHGCRSRCKIKQKRRSVPDPASVFREAIHALLASAFSILRAALIYNYRNGAGIVYQRTYYRSKCR